ncbi:MAG: hypothetical protein KGH94_00885 [Candidatus Micrarchaeota archaeon]|nr:hypothetical protein [Candidatus Micrarchaeota archaeon]
MDDTTMIEHHEVRHNSGSASGIVSFLSDHKAYAIAGLIYLAIALVNFWPVALHLTSYVAGTGGDTLQNLWGIWFISYSLFTLHHGIWYTNLLFWPIGANLVYQTFVPLASFLVSPFTGLSLGLAYNIIFFAGFCLSGVTMFVLAKYLTKNSYAAFIAGLIFSFSAAHIAQSYGHLHFVNVEWIPLGLYFFLRLVREDHGRYKNAIGLSVSMVLACFTGDVEMGIMLVLLMIVIAVLYLIYGETRRRILNLGVAKALAVFLVLTFALGAWSWIPTISFIAHNGLASLNSINDIGHNALWSDDLVAFFIPSPYNGFLGGISNSFANIYHGNLSETSAYLTYTALILAILGLWKHFRELRLWIVVGGIFLMLALGPILLINTTLPSNIGGGTAISGVPLPYQLLNKLPLFGAIREPGRYDFLFTIAFAVMAAYGTKALLEWGATQHQAARSGVGALAIVAVLAVLIFIEANGMPLSPSAAAATTTPLTIPKVYADLSQVQGNFTVLQLPIIGTYRLPDYYGGKAMYYQTASHKAIVGGYTTRENASQELSLYQIPLAVSATTLINYGQMVYMSPVKENYTNQTLLTLYNYDVAFITLDKTAYNDSELNQLADYLYTVFGSPIYNDNTTTLFSTQNAVNRAVYRSFVAYPVLSDWNQSVVLVNGGYVEEWVPTGPGAISVFAPEANQSELYNTLYHRQVYYTNGTISFTASSAVPQKLYLAVPKGQANYSVIAYANLTAQFNTFTFNVPMAAGPVGNTYFFLPQYADQSTRILNISFGRG